MNTKQIKFKEKLEKINQEISNYPNVKLVAATKYFNIEDTKALASCGQLDLGENRVENFLEKYELLKDMNIKWHFFGVIQSRKVKDIVNKIDCLHSLSSLPLAVELDKKLESTLDCFIQINISEEENKDGIPPLKLKSFVKSLSRCSNIRIIGLMCIATNTWDTEVIEKQFARMQKLQHEVQDLKLEYAPCTELSMGMTNDYKLALKYGATYIRLGKIFLS